MRLMLASSRLFGVQFRSDMGGGGSRVQWRRRAVPCFTVRALVVSGREGAFCCAERTEWKFCRSFRGAFEQHPKSSSFLPAVISRTAFCLLGKSPKTAAKLSPRTWNGADVPVRSVYRSAILHCACNWGTQTAQLAMVVEVTRLLPHRSWQQGGDTGGTTRTGRRQFS